MIASCSEPEGPRPSGEEDGPTTAETASPTTTPAHGATQMERNATVPATAAIAEPTGAWETGKGLAVVAAWLVGGVVAAIIITRRDTVDR